MERAKQKEEAIKRLEKLHLHPNVVKEFQKSDVLYYSERSPLGGILYWVSNNPEWAKKISTWEQEHEALVYHATHEFTGFGECLTLLYVSKDEEEWEYDREDLDIYDPEYGWNMIACVLNLTMDEEEFGSVCMKERGGGLIRTA